MAGIAGILLAAGAGRRMGTPKALVTDPGDAGLTLVERGLRVLHDARCTPVLVVVGAAADEVTRLAGAADRVVVAPDWASGQSASLVAALGAAQATDAYAACVMLVDLPDVGPDAVRRVIRAAGPRANALARAAYGGVPGHPVVIGRDHWAGVIESANGDHGARDYLATHRHGVVECGDLASGRDVDTPSDLSPPTL
jgi:CTP:molybdopterin cytidylyltransferase MocA